MLRDIYWPSDLKTDDFDPAVSASKKLETINASQVIVKADPADNDFTLSLPFGPLLDVSAPPLKPDPEDLYLWLNYLDLSDPALFRKGIGSRLIRAAVRYAHSRSMNAQYVYGQGARLGSVNAVVSVFGAEAVEVCVGPKMYGRSHGRDLDAFLIDRPPVEGETYYVDSIKAQINPQQAASWELPVPPVD